MNCRFDMCELINTFFGGIIAGLIASFFFVWLSDRFRCMVDSRRYRYLRTPTGAEYDWICYSMKEKNGRLRKDNPNGSTATIAHKKGNTLNIRLKQSDNEIWNGKLTMTDRFLGTLSFHYEDRHEYGFKDVFVMEEIENGKRYDVLFLIPKGTGSVYGNELLRRKKTGP